MKKLLGVLSILLSACSTLPDTISQVPENNLTLRHVMINSNDSFVGEQVRWGGKIISVKNESDYSTIEIRQLPLTRNGFPLQNLPSGGVFIGQSNQHYDSELYQQGLLITFSGVISSKEMRIVNKKEQDSPIITIQDIHLWPHDNSKGRVHTYTGVESRTRGYGEYGSGHYKTY